MQVRPVRVVLAVGLGCVVGAGTAVLQQHLGYPWHVLANSASPWLSAMFAAGAFSRGSRAGALNGLAVALFELGSYYTVAAAFGWPFLGGRWIVLWFVAGVLAGPLFGWAGSRWRYAGRSAGFSSALVPAAWLVESLDLASRFGADAPARLFAAVGVLSAVLLGFRQRRYLALGIGTVLAVPIGVLIEAVLALLYRRLS